VIPNHFLLNFNCLEEPRKTIGIENMSVLWCPYNGGVRKKYSHQFQFYLMFRKSLEDLWTCLFSFVQYCIAERRHNKQIIVGEVLCDVLVTS
jgi:hypothetical protein